MSAPKVSIVLTSYQQSAKRYLDLCVKSIKNLNYLASSVEVIIVGKQGYMPEYPGCKTVAPPEAQYWNARGSNFGISHISPDSKFIMFCNDDLIFTRDSLHYLVEAAGDRDIMLNAISCCDNYIQYALDIGFRKNGHFYSMPDRFYKYEQLEAHFQELMNTGSQYHAGFVYQQYLCMYATLIPVKVWKMVGEFDENFRIGPEDIDYSIRAKQKGVMLASCLNAVIHHFGGSSNGATLTDEIRRSNTRYFKQKWGAFPPGQTEADA